MPLSAENLRAFGAELALTRGTQGAAAGTASLLGRFFDASLSKGIAGGAVAAGHSAAESSGNIFRGAPAFMREQRAGDRISLKHFEQGGDHGLDPAPENSGAEQASPEKPAPAQRLGAPAQMPGAPVPGERRLAVLGMLWSFLAIASMYIVMPVRAAFLLTQFGPEVMPWVFMASAAFTGLAAWTYGRFSDRPRGKLLGGALAVLGAGLVGWWLAAPIAMASGPVAFAFSMWTDAFSIMSVTLFWTYAADRFKGETAKKWFGAFAAAGALGTIFGSGLTRYLVAAIGAPALLLIAAGTFAAIGAVFWAMERTVVGEVSRRAEGIPAQRLGAHAQELGAAESGGALATAKMIATSPFLLALTAMVFLERLVPDFGQYLFNLQAQQVYTTKEAMAAFMAGFGMWAGIASLVMSALVTRWVLKKAGVGKTLLSAPLASLFAFLAMGFAPTLGVTVAANGIEGLQRYTIFKAAKEATYTTADKNVIYRAKAYIEMFVYRFARGIAGLLLLFLTGPALLAWGPSAVAWAAVPLALAWVYAAWRVGREYRKTETAREAGSANK